MYDMHEYAESVSNYQSKSTYSHSQKKKKRKKTNTNLLTNLVKHLYFVVRPIYFSIFAYK